MQRISTTTLIAEAVKASQARPLHGDSHLARPVSPLGQIPPTPLCQRGARGDFVRLTDALAGVPAPAPLASEIVSHPLRSPRPAAGATRSRRPRSRAARRPADARRSRRGSSGPGAGSPPAGSGACPRSPSRTGRRMPGLPGAPWPLALRPSACRCQAGTCTFSYRNSGARSAPFGQQSVRNSGWTENCRNRAGSLRGSKTSPYNSPARSTRPSVPSENRR